MEGAPKESRRAARVLVSFLLLAMLAGLLTAATLARRREDALASRSPVRPWVTVRPIGGPRLSGDLGQFELASLAATLRVTSDPVPGPSPAGFAARLRDETRYLYDCYRRELDLGTARPTHVAVQATLWPSGSLTDVAATAEPASAAPLRTCVEARLVSFGSGWSSRTATIPVTLDLDFSPR